MREQLRRSSTRRPGVWIISILAIALVGCSSGTSSPGTSSTSTSTSAVATSTSASPSTTGSASTIPSTSPTSAATTPPPTSPATTAPGHVPGTVKVVTAAPGGGSGEVMVTWNAVAGATGYRVERAATATGSFAAVAVFDITTGHATVAADVTNLWSTGYMYVPATGVGSLPDRSPSFEYVEYPETTSHCFRVFAVNGAGRSPASAVVCSGPPA